MTYIRSVLKLALIETIKSVKNRKPNKYSGIVRVKYLIYGIGFTIIHIYQKIEAAHLILDNLII